jgi:hypothetical protein
LKKSNPLQSDLFSGASINGDAAPHQGEESGSIPTAPLQIQAKKLKLMPIESASHIWLTKHYIKRDVPGLSLTLGVYSPTNELVGAIGFSQWVVFAPPGGRPDKWELRRLWLDDRCGKNSESRVIRVALRYIKKLCPHVKQIIAYSDLSVGHKGTIYRASGFIYDGETEVNEKNSYGSTKEIHRTVKRRYIAYL